MCIYYIFIMYYNKNIIIINNLFRYSLYKNRIIKETKFLNIIVVSVAATE